MYIAMTGILIRQEGITGMAEETSPDLLRAAAPGWAADIDRLGPWSAVLCQSGDDRADCRSCATELAETCLITGPCTSSLDVARYLSHRKTISDWDSVLALSQRAGRGQLGRDWHSPPGNIYGAWQLPTLPAPFDDMLSLVVGHVISRCLQDLGLVVRLKWPNDLMIDGKKVGGILVEERDGVVIAGIGLNLASAPNPDLLREQHAAPAGCLDDLGGDFTPLKLWLQLTSRGKIYMSDMVEQGSQRRFIQSLTASLAYLGEPVMVLDPHAESFPGRIVGLCENGWLKVLANGSERHIRSGSIYPLGDQLT